MQVRCTQCGAALELTPDVRLLECPFCAAALAVGGEGTVFHLVLAPTLDETAAAAALRRFLAGDATVAGLDREARIGSPERQLFPFWGFEVGASGGPRTLLMPAAPSALQGLQAVELPAGAAAHGVLDGWPAAGEPEVPVDTAREWLHQRHPELPERRAALYHLPLYRFAYVWRGRSYSAAVDGVSGRVWPADYPVKAEAPYRLVAGLALVVFALEGLLVSDLVAKAALYLVSAPPLLGLAWWTCRKV